MNPLKSLGRVFINLTKLISRGFRAANENGLTDEIIELALDHIVRVDTIPTDNDTKREAVVHTLIALGTRESIARLAVELAYQIFKKESH